MNDDLERMLGEPAPATRPAQGSPRVQLAPRVQGGPLLDGAARLDGVPVARETPAAAGKTHGLSGPHLDVPSKPSTPPAGVRLNGPAHNDAAAMVGHQLVAVNLKKSYRKGPVEIPVLRGVHLGVRRGEFLAVVGSSGSGKSTLLHLLGTLDAPNQGEVHFEGRRIDNLPGRDRDTLRNRHFGMIFQFYHLLPELNTLENVLAPLMIGQSTWAYLRHRSKHRAAAMRLLELVGLGHRLKHRPRELSGGEMQRAAIARALVTSPRLLLADEPTGNLDQKTGLEIMDILCSLNRQENLTIVMVSHDHAIAGRADRVIRLVDGRVEEEG